MDIYEFQELWESHRCSRLAFWTLYRKQVDLPGDDFVQECWIRAYQHADEYDPGLSAFGTWFAWQALATMEQMTRRGGRLRLDAIEHSQFEYDDEGGEAVQKLSAIDVASFNAWMDAEVELVESGVRAKRKALLEIAIEEMKASPSPKIQKEAVIVEAMLSYLGEFGFLPTYRRLMDLTGLSPSTVLNYRIHAERTLRSRLYQLAGQ